MDEGTSRPDQLEERLIEFAARLIGLTRELPKTPAGRHIAMQILRSGTAPAANYAEARGAESRADFIHKLGIVHKELNQTSVWLRILLRIVAEKKETIGAFSRKTMNSGGLSALQSGRRRRDCGFQNNKSHSSSITNHKVPLPNELRSEADVSPEGQHFTAHHVARVFTAWELKPKRKKRR